MSKMPTTMKIGMGVAFLAAILGFAGMAYAWNGSVDSAPLVGLCMLVSMIFFAVAGCFSSYSPVKSGTVIVLSALAVAFVVISLIWGAMILGIGIILLVLGIACVALASFSGTKNWIDTNRA